MELLSPLRAVVTIGALGWPIGLFGFGGFDNDTGSAVIGIGCLLIVGAFVTELALRARDKRRMARMKSGGK